MRLYVRNFLKGGDAVSEREIGYFSTGIGAGAVGMMMIWLIAGLIF